MSQRHIVDVLVLQLAKVDHVLLFLTLAAALLTVHHHDVDGVGVEAQGVGVGTLTSRDGQLSEFIGAPAVVKGVEVFGLLLQILQGRSLIVIACQVEKADAGVGGDERWLDSGCVL